MKMMADRAFGEFDFIESVCEMFRSMPNNGFEGIGDDCAVLPNRQRRGSGLYI